MLIIFTKRSRVLNMQGFWTYQSSEYASGSEDARVLNMSGLTGFWICLNMSDYVWLNMPGYVWMAFVLYFPIAIPCLLERVLTYFSAYTKLEVLVLKKMMLFLVGDTKIDFFYSSCNFIGFCFRLDIFTSKISNLLLSLGAERGGGCESWYTLI